MREILDLVWWGNKVENYLYALAIIIGGIILIRLIRKKVVSVLKKWADKSENTIDDFLVSLLEKNLLPVFNLGAIYAGLNYLTLTPKVDKIISVLYGIAITWYVVKIVLRFVRHALEGYAGMQEDADIKKKQMFTLMAIINVIIWALALIILMSNLGFNVTGIVAGLGIGGIALALAAQTILGDLFSYFVIFFDKPFQIGDFIIVDDKLGSVEKIGLKTTRIRSLTGEQLIMSNTNLTNSRVHNYKQMQRRRIAFALGVTYQTPADKLEQIPAMVEEIVRAQENATFDRCHFKAFGDFSLNFEIVYFVEEPDMVLFMNIQQAINFTLYRAFEKAGIEFAYPTQTLFIEKPAFKNGKVEVN